MKLADSLTLLVRTLHLYYEESTRKFFSPSIPSLHPYFQLLHHRLCMPSSGRFTPPVSEENWDALYKYSTEAQRSKLTSDLNVCPTSAAEDS